MPEFRCTRNSPYKVLTCPGRNDLTARQGYYINAPSSWEALKDMGKRFPKDLQEYGSEEAAFTVQDRW